MVSGAAPRCDRPSPILGIGGGLRLNGGMGSSAVEQLWQTLSENELALVCVRGPECEWADLMTAADDGVGELTWLARETSEIAEQYPHGAAHHTSVS